MSVNGVSFMSNRESSRDGGKPHWSIGYLHPVGSGGNLPHVITRQSLYRLYASLSDSLGPFPNRIADYFMQGLFKGFAVYDTFDKCKFLIQCLLGSIIVNIKLLSDRGSLLHYQICIVAGDV